MFEIFIAMLIGWFFGPAILTLLVIWAAPLIDSISGGERR